MIIRINESKILTKHISWELKPKFDDIKFNLNESRIIINVDVGVKIWNNIVFVKKIIFGILLHVVVKIKNNWQVLLEIHWWREMKIWRKTKKVLPNFNKNW